eukprot:2144445-Pleurochrysis_carterae.AAC.1
MLTSPIAFAIPKYCTCPSLVSPVFSTLSQPGTGFISILVRALLHSPSSPFPTADPASHHPVPLPPTPVRPAPPLPCPQPPCCPIHMRSGLLI